MRNGLGWAALAAALVVAAGLSTPAPAQGRGHGFGVGGAFGPGGPSFSPEGYPPGFASPGQRMGWGGAATPPGWRNSHGMRRGWNGGALPPGLARRVQ
jgi:hypothetical protein